MNADYTKVYEGAKCPYCKGPLRCKDCGITCRDAGGLTETGQCAGCSAKAS